MKRRALFKSLIGLVAVTATGAKAGYSKRKSNGIMPLYTSSYNINYSSSARDNAINLNKLIDNAIAQGRAIIVDEDAIIDDVNIPVRKKTEVFFYCGGGQLKGLYRRESIPLGAPTNVRVSNGLCQSGMTQFYLAKEPNVVIMGDSISTDGPNALSNADSMVSIITRKIVSDNNGRKITVTNRAIGGQTWLNANTKPTGFPLWYEDTSKNWLDYVRNDSPDLLILAFGMNDANGFNAGALHAVVNKINEWDKVPSLLFITNPVPAISTTWCNGSGFYATIYQEGRDWAAGYARSYAKFYGYSILDINRQFCLLRDGRDYIGIPLAQKNIYKQSYIKDTSLIVRDFSLKGDIASWPINKTLAVKVGIGELDIVYLTNSEGKLKITAFCEGDHINAYYTVQTSALIVPGTMMDISVQDNVFTLFAGKNKVISFNLIRTGGEMPISVEYTDVPNSGPFASIIVCAGNFLQCVYTARDSDIWGHDDGTANTKLPEGGNGINHYSSKGLALIVEPVVEAFDWRPKSVEISTPINGFSVGVAAQSPVLVTRKGNIVSLVGRLSCSKNSGVLFTLPAEYRPSAQKIVSTASIESDVWKLCMLDIEPDGTVHLGFGSASAMLSLDGVSFEI
ncbi:MULTISPECIES: SGNH/GDSL hydrolase family protein [Enterobacteriaceae]|uniref:SGNH/GDSL hydrolase family protein n=1 Tax=Enterobacteriaceae TaxID=543 RepID=UPI0011A7FF31|nr:MULTISPECIES: SGNH/GDSL hydrolase family protein [Enterobacteriaceae]